MTIVGLVQADNASNTIKWKALLNQETFYKEYKDTNLKYYRENLQLQNSSWSGSISGFLFDENVSNV